MEKKQFITAGILILASVGLIGAMESEPKAETENKAEGLAARILELERKIDAQEKLIATLKKQLKDKKEENRKLRILCKRYDVPESAYRELMDPRKQRPDGAVKVPCDIVGTKRGVVPGRTIKAVGQPLRFNTLEIGELGWVRNVPVHQVVDDTNAIIKILVGNSVELDFLLISESRKKRRDPSYHTSFGDSERAVWLKGVSMKDVADGSWIEINHLMKITGTTSFINKKAEGAKATLFVIEKIPYYFPRGYGPEGKLRKK